MKIQPLIEKIKLLESNLGDRNTYTDLKYFDLKGEDILQVQKAGKRMAKHLGLQDLIFIVSYVNQYSDTGGQINLNNSKNVFIEINSDLKAYGEIVLAILAHEICHKFLHLNNIRLFPDYENEILTDAATVYTGLGKFSLNGCKVETVTNTKYDTIRESYKTGYLTKDQFSFIYYLICSMHKVSKYEMEQGLEDEVISSLNRISKKFKEFSNDILFREDYPPEGIISVINNISNESQIDYAKFKRNIKIIEERIIKLANKKYNDFHFYLKSKRDFINSKANKNNNKERLNYLNNLLIYKEFKTLSSDIFSMNNEVFLINNELNEIITRFITNDLTSDLEDLSNLLMFECPICQNKMKINKIGLARIKCSKCNYNFIVDTSGEIETKYERESETETKSERIKKSPFKRVWEFLKYIFYDQFFDPY